MTAIPSSPAFVEYSVVNFKHLLSGPARAGGLDFPEPVGPVTPAQRLFHFLGNVTCLSLAQEATLDIRDDLMHISNID